MMIRITDIVGMLSFTSTFSDSQKCSVGELMQSAKANKYECSHARTRWQSPLVFVQRGELVHFLGEMVIA